jgi:putative ABC transport system permease protein
MFSKTFGTMMEALLQDVKHSFRSFRRSPGFTLTAVGALAIGMGANTAIFSVVNTVLLKPLAYPDPGRIVQFLLIRSGVNWLGASATKFNLWREQTSSLQDISAYRLGSINLTGGAYPEQIPMAQVSADCFRLFGAPIEQGRAFTPEEDRPGGARVAVLSHGFWQRRFGRDPGIIGKTILLGGEPYTVVGIIGPGFDLDSDPPPEVWLPFQIDPHSTDQAHYFVAAARLKPGITLAMANAQMQLAAAEFRRKYPNGLGTRDGFAVEPLQEQMVSDVRPSLLVLTGAVSLVLLIACANVANLLLIRATGRKREIAIRAALGAGRGRIVRQLVTESALLWLIGGAFGLALGIWGVRALLAINPGDVPRIGAHGAAVTADWRVALFTILVSLATGVFFGLIPAFEASRGDLNAPLKQTSSRSGTGFRLNRMRSVFVVSETALAMILLVGSSLLIRTFVALRAVNPGFDSHHVLALRMSLAGTRLVNTPAVGRLVRDAVQRLDALPGVVAAGAASAVPLEIGSGLPFDIVERPLANGAVRVGWTSVSPGYFDVFRIPILRGRNFTDRDDSAAAGVAIINQTMARTFWPDRDPIGDRIIIGKGYGPGFDEPARQIVGIAADIHDDGLNRNPTPMIHVPVAQMADGITTLLARVAPIAWIVRTRSAPRSLSRAIETELRQATGGLPVASTLSMDEITAQSTARADFNMILMNVFGAAALLLAAIGIYGLMAYSVEQRTQEIGIRMALGADSEHVRKMVVFEGMRLALVGVWIGAAGAFALARLISSFLFGVKPWDPLVFAAVPVLLGVVAFLAVWIPARRAARIDPLDALRHT